MAYAEPPTSFGRRLMRILLSPPVLIPLGVITAIVLVVLIYYWTVFSGRIDNCWLAKSSLVLRESIRRQNSFAPARHFHRKSCLQFLKRAGYVEKSQQADKARGRYYVSGAIVDVEPSDNTVVDGQRQFQRVRVQFLTQSSCD